jgi:hypothetical protein
MQHSLVENTVSNRPVAIEVDGEPQGVVIPSPEGFRFLAVRLAAFGIDGQTFDSPEAAQAAVSAAIDTNA